MEGDYTKKYYRIGDVAALTGIPVSTLRFWEKRFTVVKPRRNDSGTRLYTPDDIETIRLIHFLVKERGMHLEAAQEQIRLNRDGLDRRAAALAELQSLKATLTHLLDNL